MRRATGRLRCPNESIRGLRRESIDTRGDSPRLPIPGRLALGLLMCVPLLLACAGAESGSASEPPFREVVGEKALMVSVIDPAADVVWGSVGTIMTLEGTEERAPSTEEEWAQVRNAAVVIAEAGNLLMIGRRARDQGDWIGWSLDLIDEGEKAMRAAEARDPQAVFDAGAEIYAVCSGCHENYWPSDPGL